MLGIHARAQIGQVTDPVARFLARIGITPDALTVVGTIGVAGGALGFYPRGSFFLGTVVITLFVFSDMLDGAVARATGRSGPWGAFLDSTLDRVGDGAVFAALAIWYAGRGHSPLLCALTLYDLVAGSVTSYAKARAESLGLTANVGIAERGERLLILLVLTGFSGLFGGVPELREAALWLLAVLSTITVGQRMGAVRRQAHHRAGAPDPRAHPTPDPGPAPATGPLR